MGKLFRLGPSGWNNPDLPTLTSRLPVKTHALFFPFDLFGHPGTSAGAELLADAVEEMLRDNRREKVPTRARAYAGKVRFDEFLLDSLDDLQNWRSSARAAIEPILAKKDFLLWVAGNHLGALPVYDALAKDASRSLVLQFDAHLDIYNLSDCKSELSHGNFLLHSTGPLPTMINLGHREQLLRPEHVGRYFRHAFSAPQLHAGMDDVLHVVKSACAAADRIFIDIDCDVFDAAYFPAVAQPEPFGLSPAMVLRILHAVWSDRVRGLMLSEFYPAHDCRDQSLATLLWLVEWILLRIYEK